MQITVLLRCINGPVTWECCYSSFGELGPGCLVKAVETVWNSLVTLILFLFNVLLTEGPKYCSQCADVW